MYKSLNLIQGFKMNFNARFLDAGQFLSTNIEYYFNVGKIVDLLLLGVCCLSQVASFVYVNKQPERSFTYRLYVNISQLRSFTGICQLDVQVCLFSRLFTKPKTEIRLPKAYQSSFTSCLPAFPKARILFVSR